MSGRFQPDSSPAPAHSAVREPTGEEGPNARECPLPTAMAFKLEIAKGGVSPK